jgi:hypothetical protein
MGNFHDIHPPLFNRCTRNRDELSDNYNMHDYTYAAELNIV